MDIGTIGGIALASILMLAAIGGGLPNFIDPPSFVIVIGGPIGAMMVAYPLSDMKEFISATMKTIMPGNFELKPFYEVLIDLATIARRDGVLALEEKVEGIDNIYLKSGLQMLVDGSPAEVVKDILQKDIDAMQTRHEIKAKMWASAGTYCPAFGMIGTLIGLVNMLQDLSDPASVGAGMAVALLTTLYGAIGANLIAIPFEDKLKNRSREESELKEMLMFGICGIQAGDSPRVLGDKLKGFLKPSEVPKEE